ncbi:MAG: ABC transporter ATP-binding protein [Bryobacteraceae bacterium]
MRHPLEITSLTKVFSTAAGPYTAVKDFSVQVEAGQFVSLLGHSGCGKSTVLSIVAGLEKATLGGVCIDGTEVDEPGLERAFVFQSPSLLPWLSAGENVLLAVRQAHRNLRLSAQKDLARKYLELVGIGEFYDQKPGELSQGTQQRVSIARAMSLSPRFLLLDEPFGMLDSITRFELQDMLLEVWERNRKTVILVTHDIDEALYLSDRIVLMTGGPEARVGRDVAIPFARPRRRQEAIADPAYSRLRGDVLTFLETHAQQFGERKAS